MNISAAEDSSSGDLQEIAGVPYTSAFWLLDNQKFIQRHRGKGSSCSRCSDAGCCHLLTRAWIVCPGQANLTNLTQQSPREPRPKYAFASADIDKTKTSLLAFWQLHRHPFWFSVEISRAKPSSQIHQGLEMLLSNLSLYTPRPSGVGQGFCFRPTQ